MFSAPLFGDVSQQPRPDFSKSHVPLGPRVGRFAKANRLPATLEDSGNRQAARVPTEVLPGRGRGQRAFKVVGTALGNGIGKEDPPLLSFSLSLSLSLSLTHTHTGFSGLTCSKQRVPLVGVRFLLCIYWFFLFFSFFLLPPPSLFLEWS